jgi:hypothetical protein
LKALEIFLKQKLDNWNEIELKFLCDFGNSFKNDLVISLVNATDPINEFNSEITKDDVFDEFEKVIKIFNEFFIWFSSLMFEYLYFQNLFSSDIEDLKYLALGEMSYENVLFYHYYFKFNKSTFIEAPVLLHQENLNEKNYKSIQQNSQIHVAFCDSHFFKSTKNIFSLVNTENISNKGNFFCNFS